MERGRGGKELGAWLGRMCIKVPDPLHRQHFPERENTENMEHGAH